MKNKKLILVVIILILAGVGGYFLTKEKKVKTIYEAVKVTRGDLAVTVVATGTVQPENRLEIKSPVAGRVEEVLIKEGQVVKKGQILAWMSSTERAALMDSARAKGADEVKKWEELYRPTPVISPINGTIILKNVESGQTFTNADAIFVLSNRLTVKGQVDETDIASIKVKQNANIILDAYSENKIPAVVAAIAYDATTTNNVTTYLVDVAPIKTPDYMRSGMTANVTFSIRSQENVLVIPTSAIEATDTGDAVLVRNAEGKKTSKPVKIGLTDGKMSEVVEGLAEGEIVLIKQLDTAGKDGAFNPLSPMGGKRGGKK